MKLANRLIALSVLTAGAFFTTSALACSIAAWDTATAGTTAEDPNGDVERFVGKCGLEVTGTGHVVDNTPDAEASFIARFYFYGKDLGAGTHTIFSAYSADDSTGDMFKLTFDGSNIAVDATAAGGNTQSVAAESNKWNVVEVSWIAGGTGSLWVNADAENDPASATFSPGTGTIGSASLGAITDIGADTALFDDYVSHRSLAVGIALAGDANGNDTINIADVLTIINEIKQVNPVLSEGVPDCNFSGGVNIADVLCAIGKF